MGDIRRGKKAHHNINNDEFDGRVPNFDNGWGVEGLVLGKLPIGDHVAPFMPNPVALAPLTLDFIIIGYILSDGVVWLQLVDSLQVLSS